MNPAALGISPDGVVERGRQAGRDLGDDPAATVDALVSRVLDELSEAGDPLIEVIGGAGIRLHTYLPTRTFELAVHGLDIARAVDISFQLPADVLEEATGLAARIAVAEGHGQTVLLALTGRDRVATFVLDCLSSLTCRWRVVAWAAPHQINTIEENIMAIEVQPSLSPHLCVDGAAAAIDFYVKAFNAVELGRVPGPDGKLVHAALQVNGSTVLLNDDFPEYNDGKSSTPTALGGTPVTIHLTVADVDARFQQALDAGATVVAPLEDQFWGDRYGVVRDPFGHHWSLGQPVREVSMEEIAEAMKQQQ